MSRTVMNRQLAPYLFEIGLSILDSSPLERGISFLQQSLLCVPSRCVQHSFLYRSFGESWNMVVKGGRIKTQKRRIRGRRGEEI